MLLAPESPGSCGVLDYSRRLAAALKEQGVAVTLARGIRNDRLSLRELRAELRARRPELLHIQYPMARYGASLLPLVAAWLPGVRTLVTLHEFSQAHPLRRVAALAFSRAALVFTTEQEEQAYRRWYPWSRGRTQVIPLGSNIPWLADGGKRDLDAVCYFGQLRPQRGLEAFLDLARLAQRQAPQLRFQVLGAVPAGREDYCRALRESAADLRQLGWALESGDAAVAQRLAATGFVYLSYPDGASGRRGSLLAALGNGALVITTRGAQTPPELSGAVRFANSPVDALAEIATLRGDPEAQNRQRAAARAWSRVHQWSAIADAHRLLYRRLTADASCSEE